MSKITLFKEVKRGSKLSRQNSYYNTDLKKRIYYEFIVVDREKADNYKSKGFAIGLPVPAKKKVAENAISETSDIEASS